MKAPILENKQIEALQAFRDPVLARQMIGDVIRKSETLAAKIGRKVKIMEICGTHTVSISKSGLRELLSPHMELRSGPGCPVCVTDHGDIDRMIALAAKPGVTVGTFGDMMRVPGTRTSLERERAKGAKVQVFYSPLDAVEYANSHPQEELVFLGVGFETTAPMVAIGVQEAEHQGIKNFSVFSVHKQVEPILRVLLNAPDLSIDAFLLPGHVSAVLGRKDFDFLAGEYGVPAAITGFEPLDILGSLVHVLEMLAKKEPKVVNIYSRAVKEEGNPLAQQVLKATYRKVDASWRGFGKVPDSGMGLLPKYRYYDAIERFDIAVEDSLPPNGCRCGDLLKGLIHPNQCGMFGKACTPVAPLGPCMVSSEGACSAFYQYHRE